MIVTTTHCHCDHCESFYDALCDHYPTQSSWLLWWLWLWASCTVIVFIMLSHACKCNHHALGLWLLWIVHYGCHTIMCCDCDRFALVVTIKHVDCDHHPPRLWPSSTVIVLMISCDYNHVRWWLSFGSICDHYVFYLLQSVVGYGTGGNWPENYTVVTALRPARAEWDGAV